MRRADVEDVIGYIPSPVVEAGMYLVEVLFSIGPIRGELPLDESMLEAWERRRGIELKPWQAELIVKMSQAYMGEMHAAKSWNALCPWPAGRNMWKYVQDQMNGAGLNQRLDSPVKGNPADGSRKRHRNSAPG